MKPTRRKPPKRPSSRTPAKPAPKPRGDRGGAAGEVPATDSRLEPVHAAPWVELKIGAHVWPAQIENLYIGDRRIV